MTMTIERVAGGTTRNVRVARAHVTLFVSDPIRRERFANDLAKTPIEGRDVVLVDAAPGVAFPRFNSPTLVLTDDGLLSTRHEFAGVLPRSASASQVVAALVAVAGGLYVRERSPTLQLALTSRDLEILKLIAKGQTNKGVGRSLGLSPHTVKYHLEGIFEKLGVHTRAEAVHHFARRGVI